MCSKCVHGSWCGKTSSQHWLFVTINQREEPVGWDNKKTSAKKKSDNEKCALQYTSELATAQKRHDSVHFALEDVKTNFRPGHYVVVTLAESTLLDRIVCQSGSFDFPLDIEFEKCICKSDPGRYSAGTKKGKKRTEPPMRQDSCWRSIGSIILASVRDLCKFVRWRKIENVCRAIGRFSLDLSAIKIHSSCFRETRRNVDSISSLVEQNFKGHWLHNIII